MTAKFKLSAEEEAVLKDRAKAKGVALDAYLRGLIEDLTRTRPHGRRTAAEVMESLDRLAETGRDLPSTPSAAFTRESIYQDHD